MSAWASVMSFGDVSCASSRGGRFVASSSFRMRCMMWRSRHERNAIMALVLSFWKKRPPLGVLIAARYRGITFDIAASEKEQAPRLALPSGDVLQGDVLLKYVASIGEGPELVPREDPLNAARVDQWTDYSAYFTKEYDLEEIFARLNSYLSLRTFLVGSSLTIADLRLWSHIKTLQMDLASYVHVQRWFNFVSELTHVQSIVTEWSVKKGAEKKGDSKSENSSNSYKIDLPNAEKGKVVTRFPPEPSGYLHIGHAKAALLNYHVAKMYEGKLVIRFDDTNPAKEKDEFADNILKDLEDLGIKGDRLTYTSDYFDKMIQICTLLIQAGKVYADDTPVETMRQERMDGIESKCRSKSIEETMKAWENMQQGTAGSEAYCLRIKLDMKAANKALRDPVIYRCNSTSHWKTGSRYKVYPTYDFACPFVDALEGVTHALRSSEYKDREAQYKWILQELQSVDGQLPSVEVMEFSRLNLIYTVLSKRKLQWFVDTGRVEGWNDPRFPTVQGMLRRGLTLEALKDYILSQGASKNITFQEWDKIWTINKKVIDPVVPRHTAIENKDKIRLTVDAPEGAEYLTVPRHKKHPPAGKKILMRQAKLWIDGADANAVSPGEEITLMDWGNCIIEEKGEKTMTGRLHLEGDFKKTKWKWTWLPAADELIPLALTYFDHLITKKRLDEEDDFEKFVNPDTMQIVEAMGDRNMRVLSKGDIIQLERKGYFIVDRPFWKFGTAMVLFNIPDGRMKK